MKRIEVLARQNGEEVVVRFGLSYATRNREMVAQQSFRDGWKACYNEVIKTAKVEMIDGNPRVIIPDPGQEEVTV